jgi:hypothetical protein
MASTYSTNLAIELIGTGDQAGAWGNTTNTNLGTLIEQAISGYVTQAVATGTDTSITIPNGSSGVARNMFIELTGTGGASTNLIVPSNKKLYFIYNNTSSGQVTVKVAGQTGVSVPNGKKVVLVCNGTDIVNGLNYIADFGTNSFTVTNLTATSATITTLTSTSAGITTLSGTSANITTLSGTSFTTTNMVATSLTLANALGVAQGGTGSAAAPSNGQLLVGNGTGFTLNTLNGGPGVGITNAAGSITITATGTGFIASVNATAPLQSTGTQSITISIGSSTGTGAVVLASGAQFSATSANITTLTGTTATYTSATVTNLGSTSANITTLTGTNFSATSLTLTNALRVAEGGTGVDSTPTNGQLLIGNGSGFALSTLTAGTGMTITNNAGSITLASAGLPVVTVTSSTAISASAGFHYVLTAGSAATVTLPGSPSSGDTIYVTVANSLTTNVIARNGKNIQGIAEDMTLNAPYASAQLRFTDNTEGWVMA